MAIIRKRILLVSSAFYPEISPRSFRATELAKEFIRQGHEVKVISKFRDHNYAGFLSEYPLDLMMWRKPVLPKFPEVKSKRVAFLVRGFARVLSVLFEYPTIEEMFRVKTILRDEHGYDLMISFAVPYVVHWGVAWSRSDVHPIARTWVADCGDPYMGDVLDSFRKPFYFGYLEKWFCRKADYISIPVESARQAYYNEFHSKLRIIPQGFYFEDTPPKSYKPNDVPSFAYAGGFIKGVRDPNPLLKSLELSSQPFRFYVFTDQPQALDDYKDVLLGRLIISKYVPRSELLEKLSEMDFLINFDNNTNLNVPSKLIDYSIVNRPVLNIGKNFNQSDILEFFSGNYSKRMQLPDPQDYHIENVSRRFLELL